MKPLIFNLFEAPTFFNNLIKTLSLERGELELHHFPDAESLIRFKSPVKEKNLIFVASLDHPNTKFLPLIFAAETAKELGARHITLITPYLPYMRQDKAFHPGEGITSKYFATLLSRSFDYLITIDPHLHRWHSLNEIYSMPSNVLHANEVIARWIRTHISSPVIIGPDSESQQWVQEIASLAKSPFLVLNKVRKDDFTVEVSIPDAGVLKDHTPILIDDIISTGKTMIATLSHLKQLQSNPPICIGIHALFSNSAYDDLLKAGASKIITCNTVVHPSNDIDISPLIENALSPLLQP